ncbi:VOC family protein [Pseudidiomarina donghaiensis]|uniref:VOC family protein n=1 Tax=Pseudidiomarina donghaiensis TaxID=519452 RepID=UPI003A969558
MKLGCFSISLTVKDLQKSKAFYEKLGFTVYAGEAAHGFLIMKNGATNIGLFQGMFDKNMLTFNPGWDQDANAIKPFDDVRQWRDHLKAQGLEILQESIPGEQGPASFAVIDPDGNPILFDQHV